MALPIETSIERIQSNAEQVSALVSRLRSGDNSARKALLDQTRQLMLSIETPIEAIVRMTWTEAPLVAVVQIAIDHNLFEHLGATEGLSNQLEEIAERAKADPALLSRLLKHMGAMGFIKEVAPSQYHHTSLSRSMLEPTIRDGIPHGFLNLIPAFRGLREYMLVRGIQPNQGLYSTPFQIGHRTAAKTLFEWFQDHPYNASSFNNHMAGYASSMIPCFENKNIPIRKILAATSAENVLMVDVGGNLGQDMLSFRNSCPDIPGRVIVQDLPDVIENAKRSLPESIEAIVHDFLLPQPIEGAAAYYMHSVLHDWNDEKCRQILRNTAKAMKRGHSKLLVNEYVIRDRGADPQSTGMDMILAAMSGNAKERSEQDWHALLESTGLSVRKIWAGEGGSQALIEAELTT